MGCLVFHERGASDEDIAGRDEDEDGRRDRGGLMGGGGGAPGGSHAPPPSLPPRPSRCGTWSYPALRRDAPSWQVADFGLCKSSTDSAPKSRVGSPHYMAPEVFSGKPYDGRKADGGSVGKFCRTRACRQRPSESCQR